MDPVTVRDERLELTVDTREAPGTLTLTDRDSGRQWGPVPLAVAEIHDHALRRTETVRSFAVEVAEAVDGGAHVLLRDASRGVDIGLWFRLRDGELSVLAPPTEVYEHEPLLFRVFAVEPLPGLLQLAGDGTLLLPINSGLLRPLYDAPACRDSFLVYGEQTRWELLATLPICGGADPAGGLLHLAIQGAEDARCEVETDGRGGGRTGFAINRRLTWIDPIDLEHRELRIVPLAPGADLLSSAADRLRRHLVDDLGKPTLAERAAESPEVAYLLDAYIMKLFFGMEHRGYIVRSGRQKQQPGSFQRVMTCAQAQAGLRRLRDAGVEKILTQCVGWNVRGHDGMYPHRFPVEERIGGERGFRQLIAAGNDLGYHMQVHDNFMMICGEAPGVPRDAIIQDQYGEPLLHGCWAGGPEYAGWPLAYPEHMLGGHMERLRDLGLRGLYYVDYMAQPLEVNYHPRYGGPRAACARGQQLILREGRRVFGASGTENGFLFVALEADHMASCGGPYHLEHLDPAWPITRLIAPRYVVPLWQLTLSGLIMLEARHGADWDNAMNAVLFGCIPRDEWSSRPDFHPVLDDERIARLKAIYDLCVRDYGYLKQRRIVAWSRPDGNTQHTRFDDGTAVTVDAAKKELLVNGQPVPRPAALRD